jgi:hypothetical protein
MPTSVGMMGRPVRRAGYIADWYKLPVPDHEEGQDSTLIGIGPSKFLVVAIPIVLSGMLRQRTNSMLTRPLRESPVSATTNWQ